MSFQKFKNDSYCVGGKQRSATSKIYGDITSKGAIKNCVTVSDNKIQAEGLGSFFKKLGRVSAKTGKV